MTATRARCRPRRAAADGAALTDALVSRYPEHGMRIAARLGAEVAKGEMTWG